MARERWRNQDPIGQVIEFGNMDGNLKPLTIVGIAGDVRARGLDLPPSSIIYVHYRQRGMNPNSSPTILMRSAAPVAEIVSAARGIFHDLAPDVPVKFSTFADEMGGARDNRRGAYRGVWSTAAHKYLAACRGRSPVFEVFDDRSPHRRRERISGGIACFAIPDLEPFVAPVNVIKRERGDLRSPQSIGCKQHHHCDNRQRR